MAEDKVAIFIRLAYIRITKTALFGFMGHLLYIKGKAGLSGRYTMLEE